MDYASYKLFFQLEVLRNRVAAPVSQWSSALDWFWRIELKNFEYEAVTFTVGNFRDLNTDLHDRPAGPSGRPR